MKIQGGKITIADILDVYFTNRENLIPFLSNADKEELIKCLGEILHMYATDVNSSTLRELFTISKAGYKPTLGKLGYNGETLDGRPCEVKPHNILSSSRGKLNGEGSFSDFTYERLEKFLSDKLVMLTSGFVDGEIVYILEFPFLAIEPEIRRQLNRFFGLREKRKPGQYLRSASFSFRHYKDSPALKVIYQTPNLEKFKEFLTEDLYLFLKGWKSTL